MHACFVTKKLFDGRRLYATFFAANTTLHCIFRVYLLMTLLSHISCTGCTMVCPWRGTPQITKRWRIFPLKNVFVWYDASEGVQLGWVALRSRVHQPYFHNLFFLCFHQHDGIHKRRSTEKHNTCSLYVLRPERSCTVVWHAPSQYSQYRSPMAQHLHNTNSAVHSCYPQTLTIYHVHSPVSFASTFIV